MRTLAEHTIFAERYEILGSLGAGGMGEVYRARHLGLDKVLAVKVLATPRASAARAPGPDTTADFASRFHREARAIARLDHPGCVRVLDYGRTPDGLQYIAMELVEGPTLAAELARGPFSIERALTVTRQLLLGLAHAHARGVLHRDVKPENVILTPRAVLIDFGLARLRDEAAMTASGMCVGSPSYIAPERLLGHAYDARADIYAVGVIAYEMLAGARPFAGTSPEAIMHQAIHRPPRPLRARRRDVPPELDAVIRRALAKDPARRFADAEAMLSAIDALADVEEDARVAAEAVRSEEAPTAVFAAAELVPYRPPWWSRLWSWMRYGPWRMPRMPVGPPPYESSAEISASLKP